jgi:hypothetical protein
MTDERTDEPGGGLTPAPDGENAHPSAAGGDPDAAPPAAEPEQPAGEQEPAGEPEPAGDDDEPADDDEE